MTPAERSLLLFLAEMLDRTGGLSFEHRDVLHNLVEDMRSEERSEQATRDAAALRRMISIRG